MSRGYLFGKRALDLVLSGLGLLILAPISWPIIVLLRFTGEGKIFYLQERMGKEMRPFHLIKFVTMRNDSPDYSDVTIQDDPRVLPLGRYLRALKINELPQIVNILKGDMSFVGPRPLTPKTFALYRPDMQAIIAQMRPGLTGLGSLVFRNEEAVLASLGAAGRDRITCYEQNILPLKGSLEEWYFANADFWLDQTIIFCTAIAVVFRKSKCFLRFSEVEELIRRSDLSPYLDV